MYWISSIEINSQLNHNYGGYRSLSKLAWTVRPGRTPAKRLQFPATSALGPLIIHHSDTSNHTASNFVAAGNLVLFGKTMQLAI